MSHELDSSQLQYQNQIKENLEKLRQCFKEIDKDNNDAIDRQELLAFLNGRMKGGKKFDEETFNKLFNSLDVNSDGMITIDEFNKSYIRVYEEIRIHIEELNRSIESNKEQLDTHHKLMNQYRNERIIDNSTGLTEEAYLKVHVETVRRHEIDRVSDMLSVKFQLDKVQSETRKRKIDDLDFDEKFELYFI